MTRVKEKKKEWQRGEKADFVAAIAEAHLKTSFTASINELCTIVQKEISRKKLDIQLSPSILRGILTADKRRFNFVRVAGECMQLTSEKGLMYNLLKSVNEQMQAAATQREAEKAAVASSKVHYLHPAPRILHEHEEENVALKKA